MALKSVVKVSNLSNLSDARFCSGMGVELLGFGVVPGTRHYMAPEIFHEIRGWLAGPQIVGELYGLTSAAQIAEAIETYSPDYFELTWDEYTTYQKHLSLPCIIDISGSYGVAARDATDNVAYVIAGESATCRDIEDVPFQTLIRTRSLEHLEDKSRAGCFSGFVLEGPQQTRAGVTSYDELGSLLEALEAED